MKKLLLAFLLTSTFAFDAWAEECPAKVELSHNEKNIIAIHLMTNENGGYTKKSYVGHIAYIDINGSTGDIDGITLKLKNGVEESFNIPDGACVTSMPEAEKSWVYQLIRKGNKVKVDVYLMGSGGIPVVKKISPSK